MFQPIQEYKLDGYTFRYHPYMTPGMIDRVTELFGTEGLVNDRWAAEVWCALVDIQGEGEHLVPSEMNVDLQWIKDNLPVRVVHELINKIDNGELPLGQNSQMDESGVPMMTIWKYWEETRQPIEE